MKILFIIIIICNLTGSAQKSWDFHVIDNLGSGADGIKMADINGDGRMDICTGWEESGYTKLYLQPEASQIKKKWPSVIIGNTPNVEDAVFADMNCDGNSDIVSCTENNSQKIFIHWNPGNEHLKSKRWKQEILPASDKLMSWMYAEPMQVDGKNGIDLVAAGKGEHAAIGWFEAPKNSQNIKDWKWHKISDVGWVMSIQKFDMDNDSDLDLVITDRKGENRGCRWLENPGFGELQKKEWKNHFIGGQELEVMFMCIKNINKDHVPEIIVSERTKQSIKIFSKTNDNWSVKSINLPASSGMAKSVEAGDLNNDGIIDFVVSTNTSNEIKDGLIWLDRADTSKTNNWKSISGKIKAKYDKVVLYDVDGDTDLDILICEENNGKNSKGLGVVWYENQIGRSPKK